MTTFYKFDNNGFFLEIIESDPIFPVPKNSTIIEPPQTTGSQVARFIGGSWEVLPLRPEPTGPTEHQILQQKDAQFLNEVSQIKQGYTQEEIDSWPEQLREAREWTADNTATTTMLDSIISQTGESKADLVSRILTKANLYAAAFGAALGRKRA